MLEHITDQADKEEEEIARNCAGVAYAGEYHFAIVPSSTICLYTAVTGGADTVSIARRILRYTTYCHN